MKAPWLLGFTGGVVAAITLVVACSDDSPSDADAAVCDCPAAEPPLAGRIVAVRMQTAITAGSGGGNAAACPSGATVLGGGCSTMAPDDRIYLTTSTTSRSGEITGYACSWTARDATINNTGITEAICLVPAQ